MKRVLVTGASGFIGRNVVAPLRGRGFDVHVITRGDGSGVDGATTHRADLLEETEIVARIKPTHLLHMAWYAEPGRFWSSPENLRWVSASLRLFQTFAEAGGHRIVAAGTCAEYDWSGGVCREKETPIAPDSLYGASKAALGMILEQYCRVRSLSYGWGRIFHLFGPAEHPNRLVPSIILALLKGEEARSTRGDQLRDFLHVEDVGDAFAALLDSSAQGPVNIASGHPARVRDVVEKIGEVLGRRDLIRVGALPDREGDPLCIAAEVKRLNEEVGWLPRIGLEDGLRRTVQWWRERA